MTTINPFEKHTNKMFASRGCDIDSALSYAQDVVNGLPTEVQAYAMTALMVVVNTASNAFAQSQGPSPEKIAVTEMINNLVDKKLIEAFGNLEGTIDDKITEWMRGNLDEELDRWATNAMSFEDACDRRIESWIENNLDVSDAVESALDDIDMDDKVTNIINDLDLVVRVR